MDEAGIEQKGVAPLKPELDRIARHQDQGARSRRALAPSAHDGRRARSSASAPSRTSRTRRRCIAAVDQGGLGLPDRDYYLKDDASASPSCASKYLAHVQKMLELLGRRAGRRRPQDAQTVLEIETALAKVSLERVERRDPENIYHKMKREELAALAPTSTGTRTSRPPARRPSPSSTWPGPTSSRASTSCSAEEPRRLEDLPALARWCTTRRRCCPPPSWTRTSTSTARR